MSEPVDLTPGPERMFVVVHDRAGLRGRRERLIDDIHPHEDADRARAAVEHLRDIARLGGRHEDRYEVFELCKPGAREEAYRAGREDAARAVERFGEPLSCHECGPDIPGWVAAARGEAISLGRSSGSEEPGSSSGTEAGAGDG